MLRKTCCSTLMIIAAALLFTNAAFADLVAISYKDINFVQQTVPPSKYWINSEIGADMKALYLSCPYDSSDANNYKLGFTLTNSSGHIVVEHHSQLPVNSSDQFTVFGQTYHGQIMYIGQGFSEGIYVLSADMTWVGADGTTYSASQANALAVDRTGPQVTFYNGSSQLTNHSTLTALNQVKLTLIDNLDPNPQITGVLLSGGPQGISANLSYSYQSGAYVLQFPTIDPSAGQEYTLTVTSQDAAGNVSTKNVTFSYSLPPSITSWQAYRSDVGWTGSTSGTLGPWQFNSAVAITQIQVSVAERPYTQVFVDPSSGFSCTIPAGQTRCTLSRNITASPGTMNWYQSNCYVRDFGGSLFSSTKYINAEWDLIPPTITAHTTDQANKVVTFQVTEPQTGSFGGASGLAAGWVMAHNTATGQDVQVNGTVTHLSGDNHQVAANYSSLPKGNWQLTLWVQDNFGNTGSQVAETVSMDMTPPSIAVYNGALLLANHGTVSDLSQVKITLSDDTDPSPLLTAVLLTGGPQSVSANLTWSAQSGAYLLSFPVVNPSGGEYTLTVTARDVSGNVGTQSVAFSYTPPLPSFDSWQAYRPGTGWSGSTSGALGPWQFNNAIAITQIAVTVQPRSYNQVFVDPLSGSCSIPAGQTECTLNTNIVASPGTMKWYQSNCYVQSQDGTLTSSTKSTNFQWDLIPPTITAHTTDQTNKVVTFQVTEPQTGSFVGASGLAAGWVMAHNTATGQDVQLPGAVTHLSGDNYQVTVNYSSLAEGNLQSTLWARDNFGNTSSLAAETITIDQTPPHITFYNGKAPLADHGTLTSLDQVKITVTDNVDPNPQVVSLEFSDGYQISPLSYNVQGGAFVPVFPPLFPSGTQEYSMKMTAKDATGNIATQGVYFTYSLQQVSIPSINLPVIPANVVHTDGTNALRFTVNDSSGKPITGTYDLLVQSDPTSTATLTVQGATLAPGQQISLPGYNFAATGGNLTFPIQANGPGQANLMIVSNSSSLPTLTAQINCWQPVIALTADPGWAVQPLIQTQKIGAKISSGPCQVTLDPLAAQEADPISLPKVLVEFTQKPAGYQINHGLLQGVLRSDDPLEVDYQVSIYNGGRKYSLGTGTQALSTLPIKDVSVKLVATPATQAIRKLQTVQVAVQSDGAISCKPTTSQSTAQRYGAVAPVCYLHWTQTPNDLQAVDDSGALAGSLQDQGDQTLALSVDLYTPAGTLPNAFSRSFTLTGVNPNPPTIAVSSEGYGQKLAEGRYITSDLTQGQFGRIKLTSSSMGILMLEVDGVDGGPKSYQYDAYNQGSTYSRSLSAGHLNACQTKDIIIKAYYRDMPEFSTVTSLTVTGVPPKQVQARLQGTEVATDTSGVPVKLQVGRVGHGADINYDSSLDGIWEARFGVIDSNQQFNPVTDYQEVTGGVLETTLGGFSVGYKHLFAQLRLKTPGSIDYNREIISNSFNTYVYRGAAPQANLICPSPSGPSPLSSTVSLQMNQESSQVLGDIAWEISSDQGSTWQPANIKAHKNVVFKLTSGQYLVRAKLTNNITQQSDYTDNLQMVAYRVPKLLIIGPKAVYLGSTVNLSAQVQLDGQAVSNDGMVVEWYNRRGEKVKDGPTLSVTTSTLDTLIYRVRARLADAPATDTAAWFTVYAVVNVITPRPICASLSIPDYMEYNMVVAQSYNLSATPVLPWGIDTDHFTLQSEWHLPDGQVVNSLSATYSPTTQDASNKQAPLKFIAWIDGYKDQTTVTYLRSLPVTTYTWPDFTIESKEIPPMAPSSVVLTAQPVGLEAYKLQKPSCQWQLPADAQKLRDLDIGSRSIMVAFPNPGDFPVSVQVTDARGSTAQASTTVSIPDAPGCQVSFNPTFSDPKMRELLDVIPHPTSKCGHPQDSQVNWQFTVDDPQAQVIGTDQNVVIKGLHAGNWTIHLHAQSKFGKTVDLDYPVSVIAHQPPTCTIKTLDSTAGRLYTASCTDPDGGYIKSTCWYLDDKLISQGNSMQIKPGTTGVLRFEAENNAGGKYDQTLNTP